MKIQFGFYIFILSLLWIFSCEKSTAPVMEENIDYSNITQISYSQHVQPLLNKNCVSCHAGQSAAAGLRLDSWDNLIKGSGAGESIIPFDADHSVLTEMLSKLVGGVHPADQGKAALDSVKIAFLKRWIDEGAKNDAGKVPYQDSRNRIYVCNQSASMVSVIDTDARVVIRNIRFADLGFSSNAKPHDIAVEPDGSFWYVSLINDGKILKFDSEYNLVGESDFPAPGLLALNPNKDLLYVGHTLSIPGVPQTIAAIRRSDMALQEISLPFTRPHAFVADHAGKYIYFASLVQSVLGAIDTDVDPENVTSLFPIPGPARILVQMNISPNDREIYITSQLEEKMLVLDVSDPENIALVDSVSVGEHPWHPKFTPDGSRVYVGNNISNTVSVVNTSTRSEELQIGAGDGSDGLSRPHGLVISPDGKYVYITNRNSDIPAGYTPRHNFGDNANAGTVVIISTATNLIEKVLEIGASPSGIGIYQE